MVSQRKPRSKPGTHNESVTDTPRKPGRPRSWKINPDESEISDPTITGAFVRGYMVDADGIPIPGSDSKPLSCIARVGRDKEGNPSASIIHIGDIRPIGRYLAYELTPKRKLRNPEWSAYVTVQFTDRAGHVFTTDIAAGDLRQQINKANWVDRAGIAFSGRATYVRDLIRILAMDLPESVMIQGQGPFYFDDGTPSCQLSKRLSFACRSFVFDTTGITLPHKVDLSEIPDSIDYYDLTPVDGNITEDEIREGCELFALAYDETPSYPSIPAVTIGQLMTGSLAAVIPACFSATLQTGIPGSGKTRYANRWDSIQARGSDRTRGALRLIPPVINLGDMRRTIKGPGYRYTHFGGFTITVDDVLKQGDSDAKIREQSQIISDMIRSFEGGGASLGHVNRALNKVTGTESPSLHSSVRILSEIPIEIASTLERLIVLPYITARYGQSGAFDTEISAKLSEGENRELMHRAYSAFVQWLFSRIDTELEDALNKAVIETSTWNVPSRTQEKYATVIAGNCAFARFAELHGVDLSTKLASAITAIRELAYEQSNASVPLAEMFAEDFRAFIINRKYSIPGIPEENPDNTHSAMYGNIFRIHSSVKDSGVTVNDHDEPFTPRQLGLTLSRDGEAPIPYPGSKDCGYLVPPRSDTGGKEGKPLTRKWHVVIRKSEFDEICRTVSRDNRVYRKDDVIRSLAEIKRGDIGTVLMPKSTRAIIIDAEWLLTSGNEE